MTPFKTAEFSFEIPTSYDDLTVKQYSDIISDEINVVKLLKIVTNLKESQIKRIGNIELDKYLSFISTPPIDIVEPIDEILINGENIIIPNIKELQWGQTIMAKQCIKKQDIFGLVGHYLYPIITGEQYDNNKIKDIEELYYSIRVPEFFGVAKNLISQIKECIEVEQRFAPKVTHEEKRAGIENFAILGDFNIIDSLAKGDPLKYDDIVKLEYSVILNKLLKTNISTTFGTRYSEILREQNKAT